MATSFYTMWKPNYKRFMTEMRQAREDFDRLSTTTDPLEFDSMIEKYELFIEHHYEPDASMDASRLHSNLNGKQVIYGNDVRLLPPTIFDPSERDFEHCSFHI